VGRKRNAKIETDVLELREWISTLSGFHSSLFDSGHDGWAHCKCVLAVHLRKLDERIKVALEFP